LQEYFSSFALIVSYLYDPDGIFQTTVSRCTRAQFIAGPHRPDERAGTHATQVYLKPLERLAIFDSNPVPRINLQRRREDTPPGQPPLLALHPGSGSPRKNWAQRFWVEVLRQLAAETPTRFLIVGGEAEEDRLEALANHLPSERVEIARNLPLPQLAGRLAQCTAFAGHDSGISHLAAALEIPTLVLWGHTRQAVWRPQGTHVTILRDPRGLPLLPVETVHTTLRQLLGLDVP
jgi:ADP-heptose:LPS heptosyltransferase